jgi:hypothetical protein
VEEVGFEKIRKQLAALHELKIVILDGLRIQGLLPQEKDPSQREDELKRVANTCPKVTEFDLSRNLLHQWKEVEDICSQLKLLKSLKLKYAPVPILRSSDSNLLIVGTGSIILKELSSFTRLQSYLLMKHFSRGEM